MEKVENKKNSKGFSLIEIVLYVSLFAIIIGGGMIAVYQIIDSTNHNLNHIILQEEANFLLRKINWSLTGAQNINIEKDNLTIVKHINGKLTSVVFNYSSPKITIKRDSGLPIALNTDAVSVTNLNFYNISSGKGVTIAFSLKTVQDKKNIEQNFSITKYLR